MQRRLLPATGLVLFLLFLPLLGGCFRSVPEVPAGPVLCPLDDVPGPPHWVDAENPDDLRSYPEPFAENREYHLAYTKVVKDYNQSRRKCPGYTGAD